ncbi:MAG: hypothetical protein ACLGSD_08315 [Acidobacteriota bacterium]
MRFKSLIAVAALVVGFAAVVVPAGAQISMELKIKINHPWVVVDKTMPAGTYSFRMSRGMEQQEMSATNMKTGEKAVFMVKQAPKGAAPKHTEAVFDRIGNKEFLTHIYQGGSAIGVMLEPSKEEARLEKQGQKAVEETEASPQ